MGGALAFWRGICGGGVSHSAAKSLLRRPGSATPGFPTEKLGSSKAPRLGSSLVVGKDTQLGDIQPSDEKKPLMQVLVR